MKIDEKRHQQLKLMIKGLEDDRLPWWRCWEELAGFYLPKRYRWLQSSKDRKQNLAVNGKIVDSTGTLAGRVLAAGMMNGITSPSRPWFRFRLAGFQDDASHPSRMWLDEVERRVQLVLAGSNFYNCAAVMYLDLVFFGTASMLIYEDYDSVIRCYNNALGEFYLGQSYRQQVNTFAREFTYKVHQCVEEFGIENVSDTVREAYKKGGASLHQDIDIVHLIEPNDRREGALADRFKFREYYWETSAQVGNVLRVRGYYDLPGVFPRWELSGNDAYGTSPALDALGDVKQLQQETIRKGQSLDYLVRPPMMMDIQLQHRPSALLPGGHTYVAGLSGGAVGAKPAYQITSPIQDLTADIRDIQSRIRETFHNDLFKMISDLNTVRSATEIDARREEKLVQLGPVLERFENEALDPALDRVFGIMLRNGLLPDPPEEIQGAELEIQYVSIMSAAQSAVGVIPTERFLQLVGNVSGVYADALNVPNWDELLRDYAQDIGVKAKGINSRDTVAAMKAQNEQKRQMAQGMQMANAGAQTAQLLSQTDVGGGANALQQMMGSPGA